MPRLVFVLLLGLLTAGAATAQRTASSAVPEPSFPSVSRPWTHADVREAAVVLHRTAHEQPDSLPRYSVGSRSLFGRLTSSAILEAPAGLVVEERLAHCDDAGRIYEQIFLIYARRQAQHGGYDIEVAELAGMLLQTTALMAQDLEAARAELPDTSRAAFDAAAEALAADMAQTLTGVLEMAADARVLSLDARRRLLIHATRSAAPVVRALSAEQRTEIAARLDALVQRPNLKELEAELQALRSLF